MQFDHSRFMTLYQQVYKKLKESQLAGLESLLSFFEQDSEIKDIRWAAYMLATVKHECGEKFKPVNEWGGTQCRYAPYYGRGYVQLTWDYNYKNMGERLGLGDSLLKDPELVLQPDISYRIMSLGMREGLFRRTHTLSKYLNEKQTDYFNARHIINNAPKERPTKDTGKTPAQLCADYAHHFEYFLKESLLEPSQEQETVKPSEVVKSTEVTKPPETVKPVETVKPLEVAKPMEVAKSPEMVKPTKAGKPPKAVKSTETAKPPETAQPTEQETEIPFEMPKTLF